MSSANLRNIADGSVHLVVTSPPYPMIEMWDEIYCNQNEYIRILLNENNFDLAYEEMHKILDKVWSEIDRVLIEGGIVCINIGDATKNCNGLFKLFSNHSRIINCFINMGYSVLPDIIWRKQTNAPNKFMGSGMYPAGAYVTFEHEYILIFRKGNKREFKRNEEKINRRNSAYFWEERNVWFSDLWEVTGTSQVIKINNTRSRSGAFPFEIPYRLINMYSVKGDTVLDPFVGMGTTTLAAIASGRNSLGCEIDEALCSNIFKGIIKDENGVKDNINKYINKRIERHLTFLEGQDKDKLYENNYHKFYVKTKQEKEAIFNLIDDIKVENNIITCKYKDTL